MAAEEAASERSSEIDGRILEWTEMVLHGDDSDTLETFIESIPGFYKSNIVKDLPESVNEPIHFVVTRLMHRAISSNSISESAKIRWLTICFNTADHVFDRFDFWLLRSWDKRNNGQFAPFILGVISALSRLRVSGSAMIVGQH
jgi:hypothetical protein